MKKVAALVLIALSSIFLLAPSAQASTLTCVKGKSVLTVSGKKPVCPSGYKSVKVTPTPTPAPKKSVAPVNGIGVEVAYMAMEVGCYSSTYPVTGPVNIEQAFIKRTMYTASCTDKYHWQVFYTGQIPGSSGQITLVDEEATPTCFAEYKKKFGKDAPTAIVAGGIYLRWFMTDTAELGKTYPRKVICIAHTADSSYTNALVNSKPLG